jgi:hypothetical protein
LQIIKRFERKRIFLTSTRNGPKPSSPWNQPSPSSIYFSVHGPATLTPAHLSSRPAPAKSPADQSISHATQPRPSGLAGLPPPFSLAAQCSLVACRSRAGLVFLAETLPSWTHHTPTENPPRTNRNWIQTSTGDSIGAVNLSYMIGEQNPYK